MSKREDIRDMIGLGLQMFGALMGIIIVILNLIDVLDLKGAMSLIGIDIFCINISLLLKKK